MIEKFVTCDVCGKRLTGDRNVYAIKKQKAIYCSEFCFEQGQQVEYKTVKDIISDPEFESQVYESEKLRTDISYNEAGH
ncbi:MAG: hypothetical protein [Bacteriophage sp.]|nr:MAG: hypothetical protein [Bacteriophage sp.]